MLKGPLSEPALMTVNPAFGAARTIFTTCVDDSAANPADSVAQFLSAYQDDWLRVELDIRRVTISNGKDEVVVQSGRYFVGFDAVL